MSTNTFLFVLSIFAGIILLIVLWPYMLMLVGILTLVVCAAIALIAIVIAVFILLHFILIPYYALKSKEYVDIGNYSIDDAKEPGERDGGNKEI